MATGVLLGLLAALFWGIADFCLRGANHAAGTFRALFFMQVFGLLTLLIVAPLLRLSFADATLEATLAAAANSLAILVGAALLYRSFIIGKLAIVSPIAASFGAIATLLALISGERPSAPQLLGLGLLLVGVTLSGVAPSKPDDAARDEITTARKQLLGPGVAEALIATVIFGVTYWAQRYIVLQLGGVQTALVGKVTDLAALSLIVVVAWAARRFVGAPALAEGSALPASRALAPRTGAFWLWLIPGAILDVIANVAYNIGVAGALTSVVATLSSLFTAVTVMLAAIFLRERLTRTQWSGVALILVGIALVNL